MALLTRHHFGGSIALGPAHSSIGFTVRHTMVTKVRGEFTDFDASVDAQGNGTVTGDLTIKTTTKPVTFDVETFGVEEDPFGNTRLGFEARTTINRSEYGIDFQAPLNSGGMLVSEKVGIEIEGSAIKQ